MSAAALEPQPHDEMLAPAAPALLRQQAADVLAAHRSRRQRIAHDRSLNLQHESVQPEAALPSRSQGIASRVTERYAQSQSYRDFLAAEAEEAIHKAKAAAEVATRTARAVAVAQQELLKELAEASAHAANPSQDQRSAREPLVHETITPFPPPVESIQEIPAPVAQVSRAGLTVKLFEDAGSTARKLTPNAIPSVPSGSLHRTGESFEIASLEEAQALDEEITFRQSPTFDLERSSITIPGNLLEFPRQLVAARKARPRYAEGPLREEGDQGQNDAQLRIFEVDATQITSAPPVESSTPEWASIWLDAVAPDVTDETVESLPGATKPTVEAASFERRIMAYVVDTCLVGMAFILFATAFAYNVPVLPSLVLAAISSAGALAGIFLIYQTLFFTFSEATPGMRYARIGLCTFSDENPTRTAMRIRMLATLLAACPLGLGLLWACLDEDRLGWHDRLSGMYQRSY